MQDLLELHDLSVYYDGAVALKHVDVRVGEREILGIVGESGSGKSTLIRSVLGVNGPGSKAEGSIRFAGEQLMGASRQRLRNVHGCEIGMVFQNPRSTFSPVRTLESQFVETLRKRRRMDRPRAIEFTLELFKSLGLRNGEELLQRYPFELSGGMCQRAAIALAMSLEPRLLLCDEPTSALDVTVQAQVIGELMGLRERFGTSLMLVTHNMGVVFYASDAIAVVYGGQIVEYGTRNQIKENPLHPYTRALIDCIPQFGKDRLTDIPGRVIPCAEVGEACAFANRCPFCVDACTRTAQRPVDVGEGHLCACSRVNEGGIR